MKRFIILSGPSCAGKGPLQLAVDKFYPGLLAARPVLCHSRQPRTGKGEIHGDHYYFLPPALIYSLQKNPNFVAAMVRSDWQAIDLLQVEDLLRGSKIVFAEVFHTLGHILHQKLRGRGIILDSVFLLPLPAKTKEEVIKDTMRKKLERRGTDNEQKLLERAESAPKEMRSARYYTHRLLNCATEDDVDEWGEFGTKYGKPGSRKITNLTYLGPNARWLVQTFVKIMRGDIPPIVPEVPYLSPP